MEISDKEWQKFIKKQSNLNKKARDLIAAYMEKHGTADKQKLVAYAHSVIEKYGGEVALLNAEMYDSIGLAEGLYLPAAKVAETASYGEVAGNMKYALERSENLDYVAGEIARLVKRQGEDTMLRNAIRDWHQKAADMYAVSSEEN